MVTSYLVGAYLDNKVYLYKMTRGPWTATPAPIKASRDKNNKYFYTSKMVQIFWENAPNVCAKVV